MNALRSGVEQFTVDASYLRNVSRLLCSIRKLLTLSHIAMTHIRQCFTPKQSEFMTVLLTVTVVHKTLFFVFLILSISLSHHSINIYCLRIRIKDVI